MHGCSTVLALSFTGKLERRGTTQTNRLPILYRLGKSQPAKAGLVRSVCWWLFFFNPKQNHL